MTDLFPVVTLFLLLIVLAFLIVLLRRPSRPDHSVLLARLDAVEKVQGHTEHTVREELSLNREESGKTDREQRKELTEAFRHFGDSVVKRITDAADLQRDQLEAMSTAIGKLSDKSEKKLEALRCTVEAKLQSMQIDNAKQLDQVRQTVDEKLQGTLERRLGESFKQVSERLEQVHKG